MRWTIVVALAGCSRALEIPDAATTITAIGLGYDHSCAVSTDGTVACWGNDDEGQLGDGRASIDLVATPRRVAGVEDVISVTGGNDDTCALSSAGIATCWGQVNETGDVLAPTVELAGVRMISMSLFDACAALFDGSAVCWGSEDHGELGDGIDGHHRSTTPRPVVSLSGAIAIGAGEFMTCALVSDGSVQCWGDQVMSTTPVPIAGLDGPATAIAVGDMHACALVGTAVECWGYGGYGELGLGEGVTSVTNATRIAGLGEATAIAASYLQTCATLKDGSAWCWGNDSLGSIGSFVPVAVEGVHEAIAIASGQEHDCALTKDHRVLCWGANGQGQLGDGTTTDSTSAVEVH